VLSSGIGVDESFDDVVSTSVVVATDGVVGLDDTVVVGTLFVTVVGFRVVVDIVVGFGVVYRTVK
jgi:hypothetical protein